MGFRLIQHFLPCNCPGVSWSCPSSSQAPIPCEWAPRLGSAKPIACDATAGSDLDAAAASGTMERRGRRLHAASGCSPMRPPNQWHPAAGPGVRPGGPTKAEPGRWRRASGAAGAALIRGGPGRATPNCGRGRRTAQHDRALPPPPHRRAAHQVRPRWPSRPHPRDRLAGLH